MAEHRLAWAAEFHPERTVVSAFTSPVSEVPPANIHRLAIGGRMLRGQYSDYPDWWQFCGQSCGEFTRRELRKIREGASRLG